MSCKDKPITSKSKHYTSLEKKVFLQILEKYKNVIELKKSDTTMLKDKDIAWSEICQEFNQSTLISQERNVQQLKKLWANLKQSQRDALTKEKQARLATGGGPPEQEANIDPDILNIAPHLMKTAPVLFTSNMTEKEIEDKRELTFDIICSNEDLQELDDTNKENVIMLDDENDVGIAVLKEKHEFASNIIPIEENKNKLDNTKKEKSINDESNKKIVDLQVLGMLT